MSIDWCHGKLPKTYEYDFDLIVKDIIHTIVDIENVWEAINPICYKSMLLYILSIVLCHIYGVDSEFSQKHKPTAHRTERES